MADVGDSQNAVGYKRPPRHGQFKAGISGNAKGRPKGAKSFATVIEEELRAPIEVTEKGKRKKISKRHAIVKQTVNKAVAGDPKATSILLNEARLRESQTAPSFAQSLVVSPEDQVVMNNILQRIRQSEPPLLDPGLSPHPSSENQLTLPTQSNEEEL